MNGTSLDGIDVALCSIQKKPFKCEIKGHASIPFEADLRKKLFAAAQHDLTVDMLAELHHELGRFYAETISKVVKAKKWKVDLVGLHGQTVYHSGARATLQIGESSYLKAALDVPVACDFRPLDIAYGGQGAPLATLFHQEVLSPLAASYLKKNKLAATKKTSGIAVQNLGGIANVSYFGMKKVLSFDTGPANMLIDSAVSKLSHGRREFDKNGEMASRGIPVPGVIREWMKNNYFSKIPPKSCGREQFGEMFLASCFRDILKHLKPEDVSYNFDVLATFTEFTAVSVADAYVRFLPSIPSAVVLCGGGAKNLHLKSRIQFYLPESQVITSQDLGWAPETIEPAAFALLAAYRVWNLPSNIPLATGAKKAVVLGKI